MIRMTTLIAAMLVSMAAAAAETGNVSEGFACMLNPGKTMADFDKATAFWQKQMDKIAGGDQYFAVTMTPFRANTAPVDVFWLGSYGNLNQWAKNEAAYDASLEGQAADAEFDKVAKCTSGLWFTSAIYVGLEPATVGGPPAVIEAYQCKLKEGRTMANAEHANAAWKAYIDASKAVDPALGNFSGYMLVPWFANTPYDLTYLVVNPTLQDFGKINTAALTTPGGAALGAAFDEAMTCESGLLRSRVVRVPATPAQ